jgi:hypothetical protein
VLDRRGRHRPDQQVAYDAAGQRGGEGDDEHAEQVEAGLDRDQGALDGEHQRGGEVDAQDDLLAADPPRRRAGALAGGAVHGHVGRAGPGSGGSAGAG